MLESDTTDWIIHSLLKIRPDHYFGPGITGSRVFPTCNLIILCQYLHQVMLLAKIVKSEVLKVQCLQVNNFSI